MQTLSLFSVALVALVTGCASTGMAPVETRSGVLTNPAGMTLYVFDKDVAGSGKSVCNGDCAVKWPPLTAATGAYAGGDYGVIARDDGTSQWAYKGKPLYLWFKDQKPGDMSGDNVNNVWHVAKP
jgi:predicted lipoprotein with Yx(FWY)xxD motif